MKRNIFKRFTSFILAYTIILSIFSVIPNNFNTVNALEEWVGTGTEQDPYIISDAEGLVKLAVDVNNGMDTTGKYYVLDNNINLVDEWMPINDFRGTFDGQGYNINNLHVLESSQRLYAGLFGLINSNNVTIKNVGVNIGLQGVSAVSLSNYYSYAGGLIGWCIGTITILNCYITGNVFASSSYLSYAGGMLGSWSNSDNSTMIITNCYATGNVYSDDSSSSYSFNAGGLIGHCGGTGTGIMTLSNCYATGNITSNVKSSSYAGGLIGSYNDYTTNITMSITNCYATGNVSSVSSNDAAAAGGLIGSCGSGSGTITNCYSTGNVSSSSYGMYYSNAGGLLGMHITHDITIINNCYRSYTQIITGTTIETSGTPLTSAQMKQQSSFDGWDFMTVWAIDENINGGYPYLLATPRDPIQVLTIILPPPTITGQYSNAKIDLINIADNSIITKNVTGSMRYKYTDLKIGDVYKAILKNKYDNIIAEINNIVIDNSIQNVTFTKFAPIKTICLTVRDDIGNDVSNQTTIRWYDKNGDYLAVGTSISNMVAGSELYYDVELNSTLGSQHTLPIRQTYIVMSGDNNIVFNLQSIPSIPVSGKVLADDTGEPISGAAVSVVQTINGKYYKTVVTTTDTDGAFNVSAYNVPTTITVSSSIYLRKTITKQDFNSGTNIGDIRLTSGAIITITANYMFNTKDGEQPVVIDAINPLDMELTLFNQTQNKKITEFILQYPYIILLEPVNNGDVIKADVISRAKDFKNVVANAIIDNNQKATLNLELMQNGSFIAEYTQSDNTNNVAILYDGSGKLVSTYNYSPVAVSSVLDDGTYTLVSMIESIYFNTIQNLNGFSILGLVDGVDYISTPVTISNGKKTEVDVGCIPTLDETKLYYTGENTIFSVNKTAAIIGSYFTLRGQVDFKTEYKGYVSNLKFIVEIPDNCQLIADSVVVGGSTGQYQVNGNTVTIPILNTNDIFHLYITPTVVGDYAPSAFIEFDYSGRTIRQPIGTAPFTAEYIQINVPEKSSQTNVSISGNALPHSSITVFDNGVMVGKTTSNANGTWILEIDLYNPSTYSYHQIYAEIEMDGGIKSSTETKMLKYNINHNEVSKVTMYNSYQNQKIVFDFLNPSTAKKNYTWWSSSYSSFTFTVEFIDNDPNFISDVVVNVITTDKKTVLLPAVYDSRQNLWVATGNFTKSTSIPADVYVEFDMEEKFTLDSNLLREAYNELMSVDIDDMLNAEFIQIDNISSYNDDGKITGSGLNRVSFGIDEESGEELALYMHYAIDEITPGMLNEIDASYVKFNDVDGNIYYVKTVYNENDITSISFNIKDNIRLTITGYPTEEQNGFRSRSIWSNIAAFSDKYGKLLSYTIIAGTLIVVPAMIIAGAPAVAVGAVVTSISYLGVVKKATDAVEIIDTIASWYTIEKELNIKKECLGSAYDDLSWQLRVNSGTNIGYNAVNVLGGKTVEVFFNPASNEIVGMVEGGLAEYNAKMIQNRINQLCNATRCNLCKCGCGSGDNKSSTAVTYNTGSGLTAKIDPSGYIYEAVASNRLQGVTTTAFYQENGIAHFWDAVEYDEVNPLVTDNIGWYAWDVPIGSWQVKAELDGYQTTYSEWLPVPPPQLDVNLAMVSYAQPYVTDLNAYQNYIEIAFSKYMNIAELDINNIVVTKSGIPVSGYIELINAEVNPMNEAEQFASKVKFVFDTPFAVSDNVQLSISGNVESYADVAMGEDYGANMVIAAEVQTLRAANLNMAYGAIANIEAVLSPYEAAAGKKIIVHSESSQIATVSSEVIVNQEGTALIPVTAHLPGAAYFTLKLEGTDLKTDVMVTIGMPVPTLTDTQAVTADKTALIWDIIKGLNTAENAVTVNLTTLPTSGVNGTTISWVSTNTAISNTGVVTRPVYGLGNAAGTLTATITKGIASDTVVFNLTVLESSAPMFNVQATVGIGGTVSGGGTFASGTQVTLTATPNSGYSFDGWYENGVKVNGANAVYIFNATANRALEARFIAGTPITQSYSLIINAGTGGRITIGTSGNYASGTTVNLMATPSTGYRFVNWTTSNGGTFRNANSASTIFTMPSNATTVTANFEYVGTGGYIPPPYDPSPTYPDNNTNNNNTGNNNTSSDNASAPSSGNTTSATVDDQPVVKINGVEITYTVDAKGNVVLTPTQAQMKKIIDNAKDGVLTIDIGMLTGVNSISLDFNMSWIPKTIKSIKVFAKGIGSYEIKYATLAKFNGKITIVLKKGSLVTDILVDGKSVFITDYENPMIVSIPYTLKSGELASQVVMKNKTTGKVIPRSYYKDGYVYATVYSTGHFEPACIKPKVFTDTIGTWSDESVKYMNTHGVINGMTESTFEPNIKVTRAQYITMLVRLLDLTSIDYSDTEPFSDVDKKDSYYSVIMQARTLGITNGIGDNKFGMNQLITLEDMYTMTYRAMQKFGMAKEFDIKEGLDSYTDGYKVSSYAVEAIQNLLQNGIVKSEGNLNPKVTASRSITALLMYRLLLSEK